jgi:hypothetical protein
LDDWLKEVLDVAPPPEPVLGLTMPISPEVQPPSAEPIEEDVISLPVEVEGEDIMISEVQPPSVEPAEGDILLLPTEVEEEDFIAAEEQPPSVEPIDEEILPFPDEAEAEDIAVAEVQPPSFESVEGDILLLPTDAEGEDIIGAEDQPPTVEAAEEDAIQLPTEPEEEDLVTPEAQPPPVEPTEKALSTLPLDVLIEGVDLLMQDQGYPDLEVIEELEEGGGEWIAYRVRDDEVESAYVRFFRTEKNINIRKARAVLEFLEIHGDCQLAYLVATRGFSRTCKKLSKESEGKLILITGDELSEYIHRENLDADGSLDEIDE